ncbi:hypothetical protein Val02_18820 [Virgisporangium aliadipatigenens]|uniref:Activator of Hsp90 ATPase homologue 1/2-like C-terminal domain-containing protein n=1 Tax=Virgisporangium aliadipatigenens TaxID=741659 RepID=A0A8J4DPJ4_9ACTN|nr:SRPBCC domain-containing protein [Virgisporangium aliadipatigenens]GIJ44996.1 hypothetical protein Val02_18820 [Virgisporangium aliadipatigenens]
MTSATVHADGARWTLVFTRELPHPPEQVWTALTDPEHLAKWSPFETDRSLDAPGDATLTMIDGDARVPLPARIVRAERPTLLEYTWDEDLLRWELTPTPTGTLLTLHHTVEGRDLAAMVAAGWHLCLDVADDLLAGKEVEPIRGEAAKDHGWEALRDTYAASLT